MEGTNRGVQRILPEEKRIGLSARSAGTTLGRDRRGVPVLAGGEGAEVSHSGKDSGRRRNGGECGADGLWEHRRRFRDRSLFYARPFDRRESLLRRIPGERAGRGCSGRNSYAAAAGGNETRHAALVQTAGTGAHQTRETFSRYAGHGIHSRKRNAVHAADAERQAFAVGDVSNRRRYGGRKADHS